MVYKTPPGGEVNHIWLVAYKHNKHFYIIILQIVSEGR